MKLSERLRPAVEAAPWVIEEMKKLEAENEEFKELLSTITRLDKENENEIIKKNRRIAELESQVTKQATKIETYIDDLPLFSDERTNAMNFLLDEE